MRLGGGGGRVPPAAGVGACDGVAETGACDGDEMGVAVGEDLGGEFAGLLVGSALGSGAAGLEGRMDWRLPTGRGGFGLFWLFASSAIRCFARPGTGLLSAQRSTA